MANCGCSAPRITTLRLARTPAPNMLLLNRIHFINSDYVYRSSDELFSAVANRNMPALPASRSPGCTRRDATSCGCEQRQARVPSVVSTTSRTSAAPGAEMQPWNETSEGDYRPIQTVGATSDRMLAQRGRAAAASIQQNFRDRPQYTKPVDSWHYQRARSAGTMSWRRHQS